MFKHATEAYDETATNAERIRLEELAAKQERYARVEPEQVEKIRAVIDNAISKGMLGVKLKFDVEVSPKIIQQLGNLGYELYDPIEYLPTGTVYGLNIYWNKR